MLHRMHTRPPAIQTGLLYLLFFCSGAAALIFEQLWFRLAGLSLGNTLWASTAVLAAFMGGLALGNVLAAAGRLQFKQPLLWYALLEGLIAITGLALFWLLPNLAHWATALTQEAPSLRFGTAFIALLLPASAMGLTLPLMLRALHADGQYGSILGRLYGLNTLGAVAGVVIAEYFLIKAFGMLGAGLFAASLNLFAALLALWLNSRWPSASEQRSRQRYSWTVGGRWLLAAALSGALLLALEVLWFRLLLLHVRGTATSFAAMLAIVLAGIACGGLLASLWLRLVRRPEPNDWLTVITALSCGGGLILGYQLLPTATATSPWLVGLLLMASTAVGSGLLFTLLCHAYARIMPEPSRATGRMLVANTTGGMLGASLGGLALLPLLGIEQSLALLLCGYCLCGLLVLPSYKPTPLFGWVLITALALFLFPWDQDEKHLAAAVAPWKKLDNSTLVYQREGLYETVQLLERRLFDQALAHRVVTNGDSMSGTERDSRRYMKLFAWLPMALHPGIESSLLISYGLGSTAEALLSDPQLKTLQVVDISAEILAASRLTHAGRAEPLDDPRVTITLQDGRHHLLTDPQQYDLITGEPPPPRLAGVVNLYTSEYFNLIRARLKPNGLTTYWLPVDQLTAASSQAILAAFCSAFPDCSLWSGSNYNWILLGSRDGAQPVSANQLERLWQTPSIRPNLTALGFETAAQLGTSFIADAEQISDWIAGTPALTDNHPKRLAEAGVSHSDMQIYADFLDSSACAARFAESAAMRTLLPLSTYSESLALFDLQPILNNEIRAALPERLRLVDAVIENTALKIPVFWLLESGIREQQIIDQRMSETGFLTDYAWHLGVRALADRRFAVAAQLFSQVPDNEDALNMTIYAHCRAGQTQAAQLSALKLKSPPTLRCWE